MEAIGTAIVAAGNWIAGALTGINPAMFGPLQAGQSYALSNAIAWTATAIITGVPLYFASQAMMPKMATMLGRTDTIRSPIQSRKIIYGKTVVGGTILYISESEFGGNIDRGNLYVLLAIAGHEVEAYETVFLMENP